MKNILLFLHCYQKKNLLFWDLHEIPFRFENIILKKVFQYIEKKSKKIIHANEYRIKYLIKSNVIKLPKKHIAIRNFPDKKLIFSNNIDKEYKYFKQWLKDDNYIYIQGLSNSRRYPINTVQAILNHNYMKSIIIGRFDKNAKQYLKNKYGKLIYEKIYFRGMVYQMDIPIYLKNALFSIVLYDTYTANNRYCEPNRMYQAIALGVPVIVGCNEPMKDIVVRYGFGIALNKDGRDVKEIENAIIQIQKNIEKFKFNIKKNSNKICWEQQEIKLLSLLK